MNILSLFKKEETESTELVEAVNNRESEDYLPEIKVRDIKSYLVDEFEEAKRKDREIVELESIIEDLRVTAAKYDASLVTLDEYSYRLEHKNQEIERVKNKLTKKHTEIDNLNDRINTLKINEYKRQDFQREVKLDRTKEIQNELLDRVRTHKGNLSKSELTSWINNLSEVQGWK